MRRNKLQFLICSLPFPLQIIRYSINTVNLVMVFFNITFLTERKKIQHLIRIYCNFSILAGKNSTSITRIWLINTDFISVNPYYPRHPCSIIIAITCGYGEVTNLFINSFILKSITLPYCDLDSLWIQVQLCVP